MAEPKRIAITTAIGLATGLYCAGSLYIAAPQGITPDPWFVTMILYSRTLQGFTIGFADTIPFHPFIRGALIGTLFSLLICIVPYNAHNFTGAALLLIFGAIYGILADMIASWVVGRDSKIHNAPS